MKKAIPLIVSLGSLFLFGCFNQPFDGSEQAIDYDALKRITDNAPSCSASPNVKLFALETVDGGNGYAATVYGTPLQLNKTHLVLGGYMVEGVSHDGHYKVTANINLLVDGKTEYFVHEVEHYLHGVVLTDLTAICANQAI
ncbi:TPA: hypothetical protein ACGUU0_004077 [Vibrio vulnificus]|uniref:hypothetical protein n=1 Tax=Vibrio parahaemolyticus TaxID=670 RepID=UPI0004DF4548|nr:hypothetical protein [Vibrio parahaemolyticus]